MILQDLVEPMKFCPEPSLYKRSEGDYSAFFNLFPIGKWRGYTTVGEIFFEGYLEGKAKITIYNDHLLEDTAVSDEIVSEECSGSFSIRIPDGICEGMISVNVDLLEEGSLLQKAYFTTPSECRKTSLALIICTYRREEFLYRKVEDFMISKEIFGKDYSNSLEMFISDNAGTIDPERIDPSVHLFTNRNVGGSGGFARGILEANRSGRKFDRIVMMDDDTVLDYETIYRMWTFCSYLKEEHRDIILGGSMLRLDAPTIMHESSATARRGWIYPNDHDADMSDLRNCLLLDKKKEANYNGWWLSCLPNTGLLPAPMFISWDDADYSIQLGSEVVNLCGIAVWHESFQSKYRAWRNYFDTRNMMVMYAMNGRLGLKEILGMGLTVMVDALGHRFENTQLRMDAIEDFLKGPEYYMATDPEKLLAEITPRGEKLQPLTEEQRKVISNIVVSSDNDMRKFLSVFLLCGIFLPAKKETVAIPLYDNGIDAYFRKGKVIQFAPDGTGFETKRESVRTFKLCCHILNVMFIHSGRIKKVGREFQKESDKIHGTEFWMKYLRLE